MTVTKSLLSSFMTHSLFSSFLKGEETGFDVRQLCVTSVCSVSQSPLYSIACHPVYILSPYLIGFDIRDLCSTPETRAKCLTRQLDVDCT